MAISAKLSLRIPQLNVFKASLATLYVGPNVQLRRELSEKLLEGVEVVAVHGGKDTRLVAKILADHGAHVRHFGIQGVASLEVQDKKSVRDIDFGVNDDVIYLQNVIRKADVFIDGVQGSGDLEKAVAANGQLIVARCDCKDAFSAMSAVASIAMALFAREQLTTGQEIIAGDKSNYFRAINDTNNG